MSKNLVATVSIIIHAPAAKVWDALINPKMIKQYLFGTTAESDWKVGSPIRYRGVWEGKEYEDKGTVIAVVPEKLLETTYWSNMAGLSDSPENYKKVVYTLEELKDGIRLTITQDNNATEEDQKHSEQNWNMVLTSLKNLLEKEHIL